MAQRPTVDCARRRFSDGTASAATARPSLTPWRACASIGAATRCAVERPVRASSASRRRPLELLAYRDQRLAARSPRCRRPGRRGPSVIEIASGDGSTTAPNGPMRSRRRRAGARHASVDDGLCFREETAQTVRRLLDEGGSERAQRARAPPRFSGPPTILEHDAVAPRDAAPTSPRAPDDGRTALFSRRRAASAQRPSVRLAPRLRRQRVRRQLETNPLFASARHRARHADVDSAAPRQGRRREQVGLSGLRSYGALKIGCRRLRGAHWRAG